jgi:hypothetical protein
MTEWTRSTPWRQGSILDQELLGALAQSCSAASQKADIAVVVSHDCDIAANPVTEPIIEMISGRFLRAEDGSITNAKNARKLCVTITEYPKGQQHFSELRATQKFQISKEQLADKNPSSRFVLGSRELEILRRWLAARYRRHAFPDAFEKQFDKVEKKFREILRKSSDHLLAILFNMVEESDADSGSADGTYILDIYLIYTSDDNSMESLKTAQATKAKIEEAFQSTYKRSGEWKEIELRSCDVMADNALTYAEYRQLVEWRSEGLSLRSDPFGPMTDENS